MKIRIEYGDIALYDDKVDVIINAWNRNLIPHKMLVTHGVSKAIKKRAGLKPFDEVQKKGLLELGEAVLTSSGRMKCKGIIHVAGIGLLWNSSEQGIRLSIRNAINIIIEKGFKSVAIPLIGCGGNKFAPEKCISVISEELNEWNLNIEAIIVVYKD